MSTATATPPPEETSANYVHVGSSGTLDDDTAQQSDITTTTRKYLTWFEETYAKPVLQLLYDNYETNPLSAVFITSSLLLCAFPLIALISMSAFVLSLSVFLAITIGILLIAVIQVVLLLFFILAVAKSLILAAVITALFAVAKFCVWPYLQNPTENCAKSLPNILQGSSITETAPRWKDITIEKYLQFYVWLKQLPFKDVFSRHIQAAKQSNQWKYTEAAFTLIWNTSVLTCRFLNFSWNFVIALYNAAVYIINTPGIEINTAGLREETEQVQVENTQASTASESGDLSRSDFVTGQVHPEDTEISTKPAHEGLLRRHWSTPDAAAE